MPATNLMPANAALVARPTTAARTLRWTRAWFTRNRRLLALLAREDRQDCLLRVEAILGLVENGFLVRLEHVGGDFLARIRRQAMHHERARLRELEHACVELVRGKNA